MIRLLTCSLLIIGCGSLDSASRAAAQKASPLCQGTDAKKAFGTAAVCVCEDLNLVGAGFLARSTSAPANVGVNGLSHVVGRHEIGGSLVAMKGITGVGSVQTGADLSTVMDVAGVGHVEVGGDMMVGGRVSNVGMLDVGGTLGVQGSADLVGASAVNQRGAYVAPAEPCGCGALAVDPVQKVAEARGRATPLADIASVGKHSLKLGSGEYFVDSLASVGQLELNIDGAVALYIGGSFETVGDQRITLSQGSTLDLYVAKGISTVGASVFADGASPGSVRIFIGGDQRQSLSVGAQKLNASIYAPRAELSLVGDTTVNGAIFAKALTGVGQLTVDYSAPVGADPEKCVVEVIDPSGSGGNDGPLTPQ